MVWLLLCPVSLVLLELRVVLDLEDELEEVESWDGLSIKSESEVWGQGRAPRPTVAAGGLVLSVHLSLQGHLVRSIFQALTQDPEN